MSFVSFKYFPKLNIISTDFLFHKIPKTLIFSCGMSFSYPLINVSKSVELDWNLRKLNDACDNTL